MKWRELTPHVAISDSGYKVAKFADGDDAIYRASIGGEFIGEPKSSFDECREICDNNYQIMGDYREDRE